MKINDLKKIVPLLTVLLLSPLAALHAASDKPNIVIILADDLGYGDLSCCGRAIQTPNIDRLAREGTRFTDFHSNGAICSPTRCALMTGRYQQRAGIIGLARGDHGMSPSEFTIAEAMKSSGYVTGMFGKWHLGELPKFNPVKQGFDEYKGSLGGRIDYFTHQAAGKPHNLDWWNGVEPLEEQGYSTTLIADHSIDFIQRSKSKPFFLYVAFNAPHTPLQSPDAMDGKDPEAYRKVVEWMDKETGRILAALKEEGLADNTFVFFFSDNGGHEGIQACSNKPLRGFKGSFWEGGHREPAIARWPGNVPAGKVTDQTAIGMDLMPTVMELTGATLPADRKLDGISLVSLLLHEQPLPPRKLFWAQGKDWAMRDGPWKLLHERDAEYLFDLGKDLGEQHDLSAQFPDRVTNMRAEVQAWAKDVDAGRPEGSTRKRAKGSIASMTVRGGELSLTETDDTLRISQREKTVLEYVKTARPVPEGVAKHFSRSGYIHPICTPTGQELTGDYPEDHAHQHALFFAWTKGGYNGQEVDFWNQAKDLGRIEFREVVGRKQEEQEVSFSVKHAFMVKVGDKWVDVLHEIWTVTVHQTPADRFLFDLVSVQRCVTDKPLSLAKYHYGGMAIRGNYQWLKENADRSIKPGDLQFLTSDGKDRWEGNHTRPNWIAFSGRIDGQDVSAAVFCSPKNFRAPQPVRIHPNKPYFCFSPTVEGSFKISPDEEYVSRYRYLVTSKAVDVNMIQKHWDEYAQTEELPVEEFEARFEKSTRPAGTAE